MDKEIKIRILELLETRQFNDNEIARRLGCGPSTVREHRKRLGFPVVKKQRESPLKAKIIELLETRQFNDEEIARRVGCSHTIVARYRKRLGLEVVKKRVERTSPLKAKIIELLETRQFNDSEIARELGCSPSTVYTHRKKLGLEVVSPKAKIVELLETRQFNDAEIARKLGCSSASSVGRYRKRLGLAVVKKSA